MHLPVNLSEDLIHHLLLARWHDLPNSVSELLSAIFVLQCVQSRVQWEVLEKLVSLSDVGETVGEAQLSRAPLCFFKCTDCAWQELSKAALDNGLSIGVEDARCVVRCSSVLELKQADGLEMALHLWRFC